MKNINEKNFNSSFMISYRTDTAALATGISESHIKSKIKSGELKSYLLSPKVRLILREDLLDFIKKTNSKINENESNKVESDE